MNASDLFTLLAEKPFNILYLKVSEQPKDKFIEKISSLTKNYKEWLKVHVLALSSTNRLLFERYGITSYAIYVIRPDGYVGFRINSANYTLLADYLKLILNKKQIDIFTFFEKSSNCKYFDRLFASRYN